MEFEFQNFVEFSAVSRLTFIIRVNFRKMDPDPYSRSAGPEPEGNICTVQYIQIRIQVRNFCGSEFEELENIRVTIIFIEFLEMFSLAVSILSIYWLTSVCSGVYKVNNRDIFSRRVVVHFPHGGRSFSPKREHCSLL